MAEPNSSTPKTQIVSVLFLDIVGYSKLPVTDQVLVKKAFNGNLTAALDPVVTDDRIVLDTGDGAAVAFTAHPEDALLTSDRLAIKRLSNLPAVSYGLRSGIHFGPAVIVHDVNGFGNLVGDGINDAQRIMSFAGDEEVFASRHYAEMIARISNAFADRFEFVGGRPDKHGRMHDVCRVVIPGAPRARLDTIKSNGVNVVANPVLEPTTPRKSFRMTVPIAGVGLLIGIAMLSGMLGVWPKLGRDISDTVTSQTHSPAVIAVPAGRDNSIPVAQEGLDTKISSVAPRPESVVAPAGAESAAVPIALSKSAATSANRTPKLRKNDIAIEEANASCPSCSCSELLTKTSLGLPLSLSEQGFLQRACR